MIDVVAALRQLLLDDSALNALVAGRVYGVPSTEPPPQTNPPPQYVSVMASGGPPVLVEPTVTQRYTVRCYGPDQIAVTAVYQAIWAALHNPDGSLKGRRLAGGRWIVKYCDLSGATYLTEPEGWIVALATATARFDATFGS